MPENPAPGTVFRSPIGPLRLLASGDGLCLCDFDSGTPTDTRFAQFCERWRISQGAGGARHLDDTLVWLDAYFAGLPTPEEPALDLRGTTFQRRVWDSLRAIPAGETRTYAGIARSIGEPDASRAVGMANHHNPVAIIVPCHRVIDSRGGLCGYAGGLRVKRWLLEHEGAPLYPRISL